MTTYAYDRNSNVLEEVSTDASTGLKTHTKYVRDARGRVLEVIAPQGMSRITTTALTAVPDHRVARRPPGRL